MMNTNQIKELFEHNSPSELVESFVFPVQLTKKQKEEAAVQLKEARKKLRNETTEKDLLSLNLMRLKLSLERYIDSKEFHSNYTFGYFLGAYLTLINKKRNEFADEINIHETLLSQLINNKREPNESLIIRLELHSNNTIPAIDWFRLIEKGKEHHIKTNKEIRRQEKGNVKNRLAVSFK